MIWTETKDYELDEDQRRVLDSLSARRLIVAGPGSGKTRTLVACVAEAVGQRPKLNLEEIAVVTYTNAAADELRDRLQQVECWPVGFCGTLHAMALKALRHHPGPAGLSGAVAVLDEDGEREVVEAVLADCGWDRVKVDDVLAVPMKEALSTVGWKVSRAALAAKEARGRMMAEGLLSYDMVLYFYARLLYSSYADACPHRALYWDEAQDMGEDDWEILEAHPACWKTVVGDPDQSVFGFRGGRPDLMEAAAELGDHPKAGEADGVIRRATFRRAWRVYRLERNYRSVPDVCRAASLILGGRKTVTPVRTEAGYVGVKECEDTYHELNVVLDFVRVHKDRNDVAVLCRTNWLADAVRERLKVAGVPVAEVRAPERPPDWAVAKALLAALADPVSDYAVWRWAKAAEWDEGLLRTTMRTAKAAGQTLDERLGGKLTDASDKVDAWSVWARMVGDFGVSKASGLAVKEAAEKLHSLDYHSDLSDLLAYLNRVDQEEQSVGEGVVVCTVHAAKGREWRAVVVPGCEEGLFPQAKADTDLGEERRLMFVALTRAKDAALLTWSKTRLPSPFASAPEPRKRSRFVAEAGL